MFTPSVGVDASVDAFESVQEPFYFHGSVDPDADA